MVLWCWRDLNGDCLSKEMGTWEVEEEVGQTNKKRKAGTWVLVQKLKSQQDDIKGGWTKALANCCWKEELVEQRICNN